MKEFTDLLKHLSSPADIGIAGVGYATGFAIDVFLFPGGVPPGTTAAVYAIGAVGVKNLAQAIRQKFSSSTLNVPDSGNEDQIRSYRLGNATGLHLVRDKIGPTRITAKVLPFLRNPSSEQDLRAHAVSGNPEAQVFLGLKYYLVAEPMDSANNYRTALDWFERAAGQGHVHAQRSVAIMYDGGFGVPRDVSVAVSWYRKAAARGCEESAVRLTELTPE